MTAQPRYKAYPPSLTEQPKVEAVEATPIAWGEHIREFFIGTFAILFLLFWVVLAFLVLSPIAGGLLLLIIILGGAFGNG